MARPSLDGVGLCHCAGALLAALSHRHRHCIAAAAASASPSPISTPQRSTTFPHTLLHPLVAHPPFPPRPFAHHSFLERQRQQQPIVDRFKKPAGHQPTSIRALARRFDAALSPNNVSLGSPKDRHASSSADTLSASSLSSSSTATATAAAPTTTTAAAAPALPKRRVRFATAAEIPGAQDATAASGLASFAREPSPVHEQHEGLSAAAFARAAFEAASSAVDGDSCTDGDSGHTNDDDDETCDYGTETETVRGERVASQSAMPPSPLAAAAAAAAPHGPPPHFLHREQRGRNGSLKSADSSLTSIGSSQASDFLRDEADEELERAAVPSDARRRMAAAEAKFDLRSLVYYHGLITRRAAAQMLMAPGVGQGTFLLHFAPPVGELTLSVNAGHRTLHIPLHPGALGIHLQEKVYISMAELLQTHRRRPLPLADTCAAEKAGVLRGYLPPVDGEVAPIVPPSPEVQQRQPKVEVQQPAGAGTGAGAGAGAGAVGLAFNAVARTSEPRSGSSGSNSSAAAAAARVMERQRLQGQAQVQGQVQVQVQVQARARAQSQSQAQAPTRLQQQQQQQQHQQRHSPALSAAAAVPMATPPRPARRHSVSTAAAPATGVPMAAPVPLRPVGREPVWQRGSATVLRNAEGEFFVSL